MAENDEFVSLQNDEDNHPDTFTIETDAIPTELGNGYFEELIIPPPDGMGGRDRGSIISGYRPLTGNPPGQREVAGGDRLLSSIIRDGRHESINPPSLDVFMGMRRRAMDDMDQMVRMFQELLVENKKLREKPGLCRNCRLSLSGLPVSGNDRSQSGQNLQEKLDHANTEIEELRNMCEELRNEVARLNNGSCNEAEEYRDREEPGKGNLAIPEQTESIDNALHNIDPLIEAVREGAKEKEKAIEERIKVDEHEDERTRPPIPEECAVFLADHVSSGEPIKMLLRNMNLTSVQIADLEERHPKEPKEYRIEGIRTGISSAHGDRITFLLDALEKSRMNHQADLFCRHFGIEPRAPNAPIQATGRMSAKQPMQASTEEGFADSPCLEPQSDFESVLQPFMADPARLHDVAAELRKELDFTPGELKEFIATFPSQHHRSTLTRACVSRCTMDVLNVWASIELKRRQGVNDPVKGFEILARALKRAGRTPVLVQLKNFLQKGLVGPALSRDVYLRDIKSYILRRDLLRLLGFKKEGDNDWQALAHQMGFEKYIESWKHKDDPAKLVWEAWRTRNDATVGKLYDWAVSKNRLDIAALLEQE